MPLFSYTFVIPANKFFLFVQFTRFDLLEIWNVRSPNEYLFYNQKEYLYRMTTDGYSPGDPPSKRVLSLVDHMFCHWNDQWFKKRVMPPMPHLFDVVKTPTKKEQVQQASVAIRKGWAIKCTLGKLLTTRKTKKLEDESFYGRRAGTFIIHPDEILVGRLAPTFSLGLGQVVMPYLRKEETMPAFVKGLSEAATYGHIIPDYEGLLEKGLEQMIKELSASSPKDEEKDFVDSCVLALRGVQRYHKNFGFLAEYMADGKCSSNFTSDQRENLRKVQTIIT